MNLRDARDLALRLMAEHGLAGWTFVWDSAIRRLGQCDFKRRRISLSIQPAELRPISEVRNTILHEIAHALVGEYHGHDSTWRAMAIRIGCDGRRCSASSFTVPRKWTALCPTKTCPNYGVLGKSHRRRKLICRKCQAHIKYVLA